jgi:hypothetical protein
MLQSNGSRLRCLVVRIMYRMQEEGTEAAFVAGASLEDSSPPSFELLSREEIQSVWHTPEIQARVQSERGHRS